MLPVSQTKKPLKPTNKRLYVTDWFWSFLVSLLEPIWNFALLLYLKTALALDQSESQHF